MLNSDNSSVYNISGTVTFTNEDIRMRLSGTKLNIKHNEGIPEKLDSTVQSAPQLASFRRFSQLPASSSTSGYHLKSRSTSDRDDAQVVESKPRNFEDAVVKLLLEIPRVNDRNPEGRNELYRLVQDPKNRRQVRRFQTENRHLDDPEKDVQELVDHVIDADELDYFFQELAEIENSRELYNRYLDLQREYGCEKKSRHNIDVGSTTTQVRRILFRNMLNTFNLKEIKEICFLMGISFDELEGSSSRMKTMELIDYCQRHKCIQDLIDILKELRPAIEWEWEI